MLFLLLITLTSYAFALAEVSSKSLILGYGYTRPRRVSEEERPEELESRFEYGNLYPKIRLMMPISQKITSDLRKMINTMNLLAMSDKKGTYDIEFERKPTIYLKPTALVIPYHDISWGYYDENLDSFGGYREEDTIWE